MSSSTRSAPTQLVLITGLSGSGKSSVVKSFEDLDFYTVDNMPLPLLRQFIAQPRRLAGGAERIAVVCDVRVPGFAEEMPGLLAEVAEEGATEIVVLFLEASKETLLRRFSETRRPHPLAREGRALDGIEREIELLSEIRGLADMVLDTSERTVHETKAEIYRLFGDETGHPRGLALSLVSFGFKYGIPYGSDSVFDVRFLPNPHFEPGLRDLTGKDPEVVEFLERQSEYHELVEILETLWTYLLPQYRNENRSHLSVSVGCTGGRHRSVAVVEELGARLRAAGWRAKLLHRDIERD